MPKIKAIVANTPEELASSLGMSTVAAKEWMHQDQTVEQEIGQSGLPLTEMRDPDGCVDDHHQALRRCWMLSPRSLTVAAR
jgi:hypothetical protein